MVHSTLSKRLLFALMLALPAGCSKDSGEPTSPGGGGGNHAPVVYMTADSSRMLLANTTAVRVTASDPDGDQLTFAYAAVGGTVSASGPTATTAAFTGEAKGNATVTVTVSDGHGGMATGTAAVYLMPPGSPSNQPHTLYTCSFTWTPGESLLIVDGEFHESSGTVHGLSMALPYLARPSSEIRVNVAEGGSNCGFSVYYGQLTVQRPLPDGRQYTLVFN